MKTFANTMNPYFENAPTNVSQGFNSQLPLPLAPIANEGNLYPFANANPGYNPWLNNGGNTANYGGNYRMGGQVKKTKQKNFKRGGLFKALGSILGGAGGAILGNMILPGMGGLIGGSLGQGVQHAATGKSFMGGALKGAALGAFAPSLSSMLGSGASALGATGVGSALSNYGTKNAILPSLGSMMGSQAIGNNVVGGGIPKESSWFDRLLTNTKDFASKPENLLSMAAVGSSFLNRPEHKTPEKLAKEEKRYRFASMLTPEELTKKEAYDLELEKIKRRINTNKYRPEEGLYYNATMPTPAHYKEGGMVMEDEINEAPYEYPRGSLSRYFDGMTGGMEDAIPAKLSDGEYVIDAHTVSDLGDGNNKAGALILDKFREKLRKHKRVDPRKMSPKAKSIEWYLR